MQLRYDGKIQWNVYALSSHLSQQHNIQSIFVHCFHFILGVVVVFACKQSKWFACFQHFQCKHKTSEKLCCTIKVSKNAKNLSMFYFFRFFLFQMGYLEEHFIISCCIVDVVFFHHNFKLDFILVMKC